MFKNIVTIIIFIIVLLRCVSPQQQNSNQNHNYQQENTNDPVIIMDKQINDLAHQFINSLSEQRLSTLAILDFVTLDGKLTTLGKYINEELTVKIFNARKFNVVERGLLDKVLNEWDLNNSGIISEETAIRIGQTLGVEAIAIGTIADLGDSVKINARIIMVESASLIAVASGFLNKNNVIESLLSQELSTNIVMNNTTANTENNTKNNESVQEEYFSILSGGIIFKFEKAEYIAANNKIKVYGSVMPKSHDVNLKFCAYHSMMIDNKGNSYRAWEVEIGTVTNDRMSSQVNLINGVETKIIFTFGDIQEKPTRILRINLNEAGVYTWHSNEDIIFSLVTDLTVE